MVRELHKARAATGCLTRSCSSTRSGWGPQPPVGSSTLLGLGEALICPRGLWRHKGGTAARNPSMCHVRSKLRFSLRAWLSLPSGGVRKGSWGAGVGALGLQRHHPPPKTWGVNIQPTTGSPFRVPRVTLWHTVHPASPPTPAKAREGRKEVKAAGFPDLLLAPTPGLAW